MKIDLNMPFKKAPKDAQGEDIIGPDLARLVLMRIVDTKYDKKTMPSNESRMWGRILDEFSDEKDVIEIDGSQFDFLKDAIDKTDMPPGFSSWLWTVREYFDELKVKNNQEKQKERENKKKVISVTKEV